MTKENAASVNKDMPVAFDVEELIERLLLIEKVEQARNEIKEGKSFTYAGAKSIIEKWRK